MQLRMHADLALKGLLMTFWRRRPKSEVVVHSDRGTQYSSFDWQSFLKSHNLICSMSRRNKCYDNDVAESFFQLLKHERIKRRIYINRSEARQDIFAYIDMFYNPVRRQSDNSNLSPIDFERQYFRQTGSV